MMYGTGKWKPLQQILNELFQICKDGSSTSSGVCYYISKIVITSRRLPSLDTPLKWVFHETKFLTDEDSWRLFKTLSRNNNGKKLDREYRGLATEMLRKCKGLPLAVVALARLLKRKDSIQEWERVFCQLKGEEGPHIYGPVNDVLALSYYELPPYILETMLSLLGTFSRRVQYLSRNIEEDVDCRRICQGTRTKQ